jgi:hypothetical protein
LFPVSNGATTFGGGYLKLFTGNLPIHRYQFGELDLHAFARFIHTYKKSYSHHIDKSSAASLITPASKSSICFSKSANLSYGIFTGVRSKIDGGLGLEPEVSENLDFEIEAVIMDPDGSLTLSSDVRVCPRSLPADIERGTPGHWLSRNDN